VAEKELAKIVGSSNVFDSPSVLEEYSKDSSFVPRVMPAYVVRPGNVEEVQGVVKWANETLTPFVPVSSGPPHFRGDTVPGVGGAVVVDLSRMSKIIRIDPRNKIAMVEPGLRKVRQMLDPNTVADWTAYIPPAYPDYPKEGDYVLPSYGKEEDDVE
jgi:FAD/FMN-containing dehydrogenase